MEPLPVAVVDGFDLAPSNISLMLGGLASSVWRVRTRGRIVTVRRVSHTSTDEMTVASELAWLHVLSDSPGIAPRPLLRRDGVLAPVVETDANGRVVGLWTVMEWVEGAPLGRMPTAEEAVAVGGLIAELHDRSEAWTPEADFARPTYDSSLFRRASDELLAFGADCLSVSDRSIIAVALDSACATLDRLWSEERDLGVIHADLHDGNLLWPPEAPRPVAIDFGRCGVGPFALDVAMAQHYLTAELGEYLRTGYLHRRPDAVLERSALRHLRFLAAIENLATLSAFSDEFEFIRAALPGFVESAEGLR